MQEEKFVLKNGKTVTIRHLKASDYDAVMTFLTQFSTENIFTNQYPGQPPKPREECENFTNARIIVLSQLLKKMVVSLLLLISE